MQERAQYIGDIEERQLIRYLPEVNMTDRDKEIVKRYLTTDTTYQELGEEYGISSERVRQLIVKFWRKGSYLYRKEQLIH